MWYIKTKNAERSGGFGSIEQLWFYMISVESRSLELSVFTETTIKNIEDTFPAKNIESSPNGLENPISALNFSLLILPIS
jgi:hypothetical protein